MRPETARPRRRTPALAALASLVIALSSLACAPQKLVLSNADLASFKKQRDLPLNELVVPFEIDDEMRAWVHQRVSSTTAPEHRLDQLLASLFDPKDFKLEYEARETGTARQVFANRRGNCLAFTSLFVGMARELGMPVFYLDVEDVQEFEKDGDLVVVSGHVSAGYGTGRDLKIFDFAPNPEKRFRPVRSITDRTAIALFYSNRGAELLRVGKEKEALVWLRTAVALDPDHPRPWINLGVAERRAGDLAAAEKAYRRALEIDAGAASAYQNLATLLKLQGEDGEAESLRALASRMDRRNPFNYLALGDMSLSNKRYEEARRFYKRALSLGRGAEPYAALGQLALAVGKEEEALGWLKKAIAIDQENPRVRGLAARLGA